MMADFRDHGGPPRPAKPRGYADGASSAHLHASRKISAGVLPTLPFTTEAVVTGKAVMLASAVRDATDLLPFSYGLVYTRPDTCSRQREKCARLARALAGANALINDQPAAALDLLRKRFEKMDPAVLAAAWQVVSAAHAKDVRVTIPGLEHSQQVSLEARLLEPKDALAKFDGLFTDEFAPSRQ